MIKFDLKTSKPLEILALGAHCDDIEIGCGGTLLKLLNENPNAIVHWVVFSSNPVREKEARSSANDYLINHNNVNIEINTFRNGFFPYVATEIKEYFEELKNKVSPDIIFSHYIKDRHQDHRTIAELTWNSFRNNLILQYEIAKYEGDLVTPNFYTELNEDLISNKLDKLMKHYETQADKHWFTKDLFMSILRLRGIECASHSGYAEGFHADKVVF